MSNEIITAEAIDKTYETAIALHERIMMSGAMVATALIEMCRGLKQMRDDRLYIALGHDNFEAYCEDRAGIKSRQAYNYIAIYERFGTDKLESYADIGVTKLELISRLPFGERDEILEKASEEGMSASEIKRLLEENKKQGEQISLLEEQLAEAENGAPRASSPTEDVPSEKEREYKDKIAELEKKLAESLDEDVLRRQITKEVTDKQKAAMEKKVDAAVKEKLEAATAEKVEAAKKATYAEVEGKYKAELDEMRDTLNRSASLTKELEAKLKNSDSSHVSVKIYFNSAKESFNSACGLIKDMVPEDKEKYKSAMYKLIEMMQEAVNEI